MESLGDEYTCQSSRLQSLTCALLSSLQGAPPEVRNRVEAYLKVLVQDVESITGAERNCLLDRLASTQLQNELANQEDDLILSPNRLASMQLQAEQRQVCQHTDHVMDNDINLRRRRAGGSYARFETPTRLSGLGSPAAMPGVDDERLADTLISYLTSRDTKKTLLCLLRALRERPNALQGVQLTGTESPKAMFSVVQRSDPAGKYVKLVSEVAKQRINSAFHQVDTKTVQLKKVDKKTKLKNLLRTNRRDLGPIYRLVNGPLLNLYSNLVSEFGEDMLLLLILSSYPTRRWQRETVRMTSVGATVINHLRGPRGREASKFVGENYGLAKALLQRRLPAKVFPIESGS